MPYVNVGKKTPQTSNFTTKIMVPGTRSCSSTDIH